MARRVTFRNTARRPAALALGAGAVLALFAMIFVFGAHPIIVAGFAVLVSPALWEILRNAATELTLDDHHIAWRTGRREARIPLVSIEKIRLRTGLDLAQKAVILKKTGEKLRIPPECLPKGRALDEALEARGIAHSRSLFGN